MVILLVCLSILFSHSWSVKLAHHITSFTPPGSRIIPLFSRQTPWQNLDGITFKGELNTGGVLKVYDFGPISCWILEILWDHMICLFEIKHRLCVVITTAYSSNETERLSGVQVTLCFQACRTQVHWVGCMHCQMPVNMHCPLHAVCSDWHFIVLFAWILAVHYMQYNNKWHVTHCICC